MPIHDVLRIERELAARGVPFRRYLAGRVSDPGANDDGWVLEVGGEAVARGGALGLLGIEMLCWWESRAP